MIERADVVIVGAGITGCSAAFFLALKGWKNIIVVDQGPLFKTGGQTSVSPGLLFQVHPSRTMSLLAQQSHQMYTNLSLHGNPCFFRVGSLEVARTSQRWVELKRRLGLAQAWGVPEAELISPDEARHYLPLLNQPCIAGALYVASDGAVNPLGAAEALANAARRRGVKFMGNTTVTAIERSEGRVHAVRTPAYRIPTDKVLVCAGAWSTNVARLAGAPLPLQPMQHQFVRTTPLDELVQEHREVVHPVLRDHDQSLYFRQYANSYGIGSYQHEPLLLNPYQLPSMQESDMPAVLPFTDRHFEQAWQAAQALLPALTNADLALKQNVITAVTPDGMPIIGEHQETHGLWVAAGIDVSHAAGIGKAIAEWISDGYPSLDLRELDLNRFGVYASTPAFLRLRAARSYQSVGDIVHPRRQPDYLRNLKVSPFYIRQRDLGAVFFESFGWERPQWYEANKRLPTPTGAPLLSGWAGYNWSPIIAAEHIATCEHVALFDITAMPRCEITGHGALAFLDHVCTNTIDRPIGAVIYTLLATPSGGIKTDAVIARLGTRRFVVGMNSPQDIVWLRQHMPNDGSVVLTDITSSVCGLGVWGPKSRQLLQKVSDNDFSNRHFPRYSARMIAVGAVPVTAVRVSFAGELGWELYTSVDYGLHLWDILWDAGYDFELTASGHGALDSLRMERGFRAWGNELTADINPFVAGMAHVVHLAKPNFIGREALIHIKRQLISHRLCCITLDDPSVVLVGNEPVLNEQDQVVGFVTSACYAYRAQQSIAYAYLPIQSATVGTRLTVIYFDLRYTARVIAEPVAIHRHRHTPGQASPTEG